MANVVFKIGTREQYLALAQHDANTLYWIEDVPCLYKGDTLYATGAMATSIVAGLMSAEDKAKLDSIVVGAGGSVVAGLTPVDKSILIKQNEDGSTSIGVGLSAAEGNALSLKDDGLYASAGLGESAVPEYAIEKQASAEAGYATSYKLKRTVNGESEYVGDTINVAKDMVLQSAAMKEVTETNVPYEGAEVGDPYVDMLFNDEAESHIYLPMKGLVDSYIAGQGIEIVERKVSIKMNPVEAHGLFVDENGLGLHLATAESDGAMSAADKVLLDSVPSTYLNKVAAKALYLQRQYEISHKLSNMLVDYRDHEIRVLCPADTQWSKQQSGAGADKNSYYIGFKAYAPSEDVVSYKEDTAEIIADQTMYSFEGNDFAGVDEYGRKYSIVWLPVAVYDEATGSWSYHGDRSTSSKYIGWYYSVEWYNAAGVKVAADTIRINLTNESCATSAKPYYVTEVNTKVETVTNDVTQLQTEVNEIKENLTWSNME